MAVSSVQKHDLYNAVTISDGTTGTPLTLTLGPWQGTISYTDPLEEEIITYNQRTITGVFKGRSQPIDGQFSVPATCFADASTGAQNILDLVYGTNDFSAVASTQTASYSNFTLLDLAFTMEGTDFGDGADHVATFSDCRLHGVSFSSGQPNEISVSFRCFGGLARTGPT